MINPYTPKSAGIKGIGNNDLINLQNKASHISNRLKPIIFITARVHPGETPSSFLMNGIIRFLINKKDPRAEILRRAFVFKIIPIINVDGVSRGFYRYDTNSLNMNRHYVTPSMKIQPEIYAIKKIFLSYASQGGIRYYFDLHAHASSRGLFLFGNSLDYFYQIENLILPRFIELNSEDLIFSNCNFSEKSMKSKERGDKYSKEGTGRVHFHKCCEITHCYTVEASYYRGIYKNILKEIKPINFNFILKENQEEFIDNKLFINNNQNRIMSENKNNNCKQSKYLFCNNTTHENERNGTKNYFRNNDILLNTNSVDSQSGSLHETSNTATSNNEENKNKLTSENAESLKLLKILRDHYPPIIVLSIGLKNYFI